MLEHYQSNSASGHHDWSVSHVSEWVDIHHSDTVINGASGTATSNDDLLAIYNCFDVLERVWPTEAGLHQTAGPFTLEEEIGRGGMGRVWSAIQHEPVKRNVAVKLINPGPKTQQMVNRFESERSVLALMNHPSIATLIDAGQTDDGQLYFAMELVDGPDLISYCNRKQLKIEQRLNLLLDACSAVQHAHQKGIIHRDLKPSNILVGEVDGHARLKVIDFGLSKADSSTLDITVNTNSEAPKSQQIDSTQDGQVIGSLRYMSPEQAAADSASIDVRSDVYSLGIVLFKLLTDSAPLDTKGLVDAPVEKLLDSIQFEADPRPSEFLSGLSKTDFEKIVSRRQTSNKVYQRILKSDLDWIAMRAISKDPDSRYQTVSDFAGDIRRFLNHEPVLARPESLLYNVKKELSRNRVLWGSVAGVIAALLSGILVAGYALASATNARNLAEKRLEQSRKSNEILAAVFADINLPSIERETEPIEVRLGRRLVQAAEGLIIDSIGDPVEVADLKIKLVEALNGLEYFEAAIPIGRAAWDSVKDLDPEDEEADLKYRAGTALVKALHGDAKESEALAIIDPLYESCVAEQGEDSETCLELLLLKGRAAALAKDNVEALRCFTEVANRREALWGKSDLRTLDAKLLLSGVYIEPGKVAPRLPLVNEVVEQYRKLLSKGHPRTIKAMLNSVWMSSYAGDFNKTAELAKEALELARETYGENHPTTCDAKLAYGLMVHRIGDQREGFRLLKEAWTGLSENTRRNHPRAIAALTLLAEMSRLSGDMKSAISFLEEAVSLRPGRGIETQLGKFQIEVGNFEIARALLRSAMNDAKGTPREADTESLCLYLIGQSYNEEGKYPEAIEACERAVELAPPTEEPYHFEGMRKVLELTRSYSLNGDHAEAAQIINEYHDSMPASMGPKNRIRLCCHAMLGLVHREAGRHDQAIAELEHVAFSGVRLLHQDFLIHELRLAQIEQGQTDAVVSGVGRELEFIRSTFPTDSIQRALRLQMLGYRLIDLQMLEKAKEVLAESVDVLKGTSPGSWMLEQTRYDVAQLSLELEPLESDVRQLATTELETAWSQLEAMKDDAFPNEIRELAKSIKNVIGFFEDESDSESVATWRQRLETIPLGLRTEIGRGFR